MWLVTQRGFLSCVIAMRDGKRDPTRIVVRSRCREHLVRALDVVSIGECAVLEGGGDYPYRAVISRQDFVELSKRLAREVSYTNFKIECSKDRSVIGRLYTRFLTEVWHTAHDLLHKAGVDE